MGFSKLGGLGNNKDIESIEEDKEDKNIYEANSAKTSPE